VRVLTLRVAVALSAAPALAADLPSRKAPLAPPPPLTWTGFYTGVNIGGTISGSDSVNVVSGPLWAAPFAYQPDAPSFFAAASATGATGSVPTGSNGGIIGGGQFGYNYQFGAGGLGSAWVVGLETDFQGVGSSGAGRAVTGFPLNGNILFVNQDGVADGLATSLYATKSLDYLGTLRGRVGALVTPALLVYATGGLAYGGVSASTSIAQFNNDTSNFGGLALLGAQAYGAGSYASTRVGWTAGAGLEWMFWPNWSAKVEYLYYDLGSATYTLSPLATGGSGAGFPVFAVAASQATTSFSGHIFRAGLNYHFNWGAPAPVLAKY